MTETAVKGEIVLKGTPVSRGIAIGKAFFFTLVKDSVPKFTIPAGDIEQEIARYHRAIEKARGDIVRLQKKLKKEKIDEGVEILEAHLQVMQDPLLTVAVESEIRHTRNNAEYVFESLLKNYHNKFKSIKDAFFRERFKDIQEISRRVGSYLSESVRVGLADIPAGSAVFSRELSAAEAAEAKSGNVAAFVTEKGGGASHAAIVARAKGIPYVSCIDFSRLGEMEPGAAVVVDGRRGELVVNPSKETLKKYEAEHRRLEAHLKKLRSGKELEAETFDGLKVRLSANMEVIHDLDLLHSHGGHGVGLFRSEYIFLTGEAFPSEEAQYEIYKKIVKKMRGLPLVIRTFDVGGDKQHQNIPVQMKGNTFLGCRALRFLLKERELFKVQLRAIHRAAVYGEVGILLPMVSALCELHEVKEVIGEVKRELKERGQKFSDSLRIGCMIEVPSAAIIADHLAEECDFLSIGTNDLVQYSLAIDRSNHAHEGYYSPTHPSIIRLIRAVVSEAESCGIPVSICGEIAADPRFTPLLLGLGVHELSVASRFIPAVKNGIRNTSIVLATELAERALSMKSAQEIDRLITEEYRSSIPEDCFYNYN